MIARCAKCQDTFSASRFGRQACPACGAEVFLRDPDASPPGAQASQPTPQPPSEQAQPPPEDGVAAPWEARAGRGAPAAFFATVKAVLFTPAAFFSRLRREPVGGAYSFGIICWVVSSFLGGLWNVAQQAAMGAPKLEGVPREMEWLKTLMAWQSPRVLLVIALTSPATAVIGFFVAAGVIHLMVVFFCSGGRGWNATVRAFGYASAPWLLAAIPGCGGLAGMVWSIVLTIMAIPHLHRTTGGRAAAAVLTPVAVLCCCACGVALFLVIGMSAAAAAAMTSK